jgi:hypothetical protein
VKRDSRSFVLSGRRQTPCNVPAVEEREREQHLLYGNERTAKIAFAG